MNWVALFEAFFVVFPMGYLSIILYDYLCELLWDEDPWAEDSEVPLDTLSVWLIYLIPVFGAYISWGTVFDNGFWYYVGFIIGGVLTVQIPFIAFCTFMAILGGISGLTKNQKKKFTDTLQSYQVLIGLIVIALAIYFGRGF